MSLALTPRWIPRSLAATGALLGGLWLCLALLVFLRPLWDMPSFLADVLPAVYGPLDRLLTGLTSGTRVVPAGRVIALLYLAVVLALWIAYALAVRAAGVQEIRAGAFHKRALWLILGGGLGFGLLTFLWPGLFSTDVYAYATYGKMQVVYGLNPMMVPPRAMGVDPWLAFVYWKDIPAPYGPIWLLTTRGIASAGQALGGQPVVYLLGFKLLNLGLLGLASGLVWDIAGRLGWSPARQVRATVLFAWCPLVIFEFVGNAHVDALLIVCWLAALWFHLRGWWPLAVVAIVAAGLVKLPGFFLLPAYAVLLVRSSADRPTALRRLMATAGLAAGLTLAAYGLYVVPGLEHTSPASAEIGWFGSSPATVLRQALVDLALAGRGTFTPDALTARAAYGLVRWPLWYSFVGLWLIVAGGVSLQPRDVPGLIRSWALVLLSYLTIASTTIFPWYFTWLIWVVALVPPGRLQRTSLVLALAGSLAYGVSPLLWGDVTANLRHYYVPAAIFLPACLYYAWTTLHRAPATRVVSGASSGPRQSSV